MSIRVAYDAQIFRLQRVGGISRYFTELIHAFHCEPELGVSPALHARLVASKHLAAAGLGRRLVVPRVVTRAWNELPAGPRRRGGADLVHHTYYLPRELRASWTVPRVTTIHDMIPELMPEYFPRGNPHQAKREYVALSSGLVFDSESSRRDLLGIYGPQDIPTAVAHLAPGRQFQPLPATGSQQGRSLVFVGSRSGYKDFATLLVALAQTPRTGPSLVAVGGGAFSDAEQARIEDLELRDRVRQVSMPDEALAQLYASAIALVMPSRYEGFGLPIVEAMATGCPVIVSDIAVFREVADDVAEYFPVGDAPALAAVLERIHGDEGLRRSRREAGLVRVQDFTWSKTARVTADLYREVLENQVP